MIIHCYLNFIALYVKTIMPKCVRMSRVQTCLFTVLLMYGRCASGRERERIVMVDCRKVSVT